MHRKFRFILFRCVLIISVIIYGTACSNTSAPLQTSQHVEFLATIIDMQYEGGQLTQIEIKSVLPDGNEHIDMIVGRSLLSFKRYPQAQNGDAFLLRKTINAASGNKPSQAQYNILQFYPWESQSLRFLKAGGVKFGTEIHHYNRRYTYVSGVPESDCFHVSLKNIPGLTFMVNKGRLVRAEAADLFYATRNTPFADLLDSSVSLNDWQFQHPYIEFSPHEYEEGYYLTWFSGDKKGAVVAEYVNSRIKLVRSGLVPYVSYIEGCS